MTKVLELEEKLLKFNMKEVFTKVVLSSKDDNGNETFTTRNLLHRYQDSSVIEVRKSTKFYKTHGHLYDLQNLSWSKKLLENSCTPELHKKVKERCLGVPANQMSSPTYFIIMMNEYHH